MNAQAPRASLRSTSRSSTGRALRAGFAAVAVALVATGCGSSRAITSKPSPSTVAEITADRTISITGQWKTFSSQSLSFHYPADWYARTTGLIVDTSHGSDIVALSPQPTHNSCQVRRTSTSESINCDSPISRLRPDSVLAIWSDDGDSIWTLAQQPGQKIKVGGIAGKWDVSSAADDYPSDGATEQVTVVVPIPHMSGNYFALRAEIRGPDTAKLIAELRAMVTSVRWGAKPNDAN